MMDEGHLAAWSSSSTSREWFVSGLTGFIQGMEGAEACVLQGRFIHDLDSFCHQLECALGCGPVGRHVHGPGGLVSVLRDRDAGSMGTPARHRFYLWPDADVLLERDGSLFAELVESVIGVSAEIELVDDDVLMLCRLALVGGEALREVVRDPRGPLRRWREDGSGEAYWAMMTGEPAPLARELDIDRLGASAGRVGELIG